MVSNVGFFINFNIFTLNGFDLHVFFLSLIVSDSSFYRYPFYFPQDFLTYDDVYDLRAKIFFLLSFLTTELSKEFQIQEVFDQVGISRQKMARLRKSILIIFEDARDLKLIEPRFTLLMKTNKTLEVDKLTSNLLVKAKSIFYTEIP